MIYLACLTEKTDDKINGYSIIKTKSELDKVISDNSKSNRIIIRTDFSREYFTPSGVGVFINNARLVNRNLIIEFEEKDNTFTFSKFIERLSNCKNIDEVISYAVKYEKEFMDVIKTINQKQSDTKKEILSASSNVSQLQSVIDRMSSEIDCLKYSLKLEQENKSQYAFRLSSLISRINYQYGCDVDSSKMFNIDANSYDKVIYIKELSRVQYTDSFIYYLKEILKVLYGMPTRLVVIESYYSGSKVSQYSMPVHYSLKERDVVNGDILMLGLQPNLMRDILKNPSNISILIVLDRGGYIVPHIKGDNVETLYTVSDLKDLPVEIPLSRVISYSEDTLFVPYIENFEAMDSNEKITRYSSMGIIKKVVELIERR